MKKKLQIFSCLLLVLILSLTTKPLQAKDNIPYYHSFEDSQADENANWVLNYSPYVTLSNFWCIGDAVASDGNKSMYMSIDDGLTHSIKGSQSNTILSYRVFDIAEAGTYDLSFDWMAYGEGSSALYVAWIDDDTDYVVSSNSTSLYSLIANNSLTTESGVNAMQFSSVWQNEITQIEVEAGKKYKLVFAWFNPSTSVFIDPPGAIDNISITSRNCDRTTDLKVDVSGTTVNVTWEGTASSYEVKYKLYTDAEWTQSSLTTTSVSYSNLTVGAYDFAVRSICDGDTGVWVYSDKKLVYSDSEMCIDYIDLESATCSYGTFSYPYVSIGAVDYGYEAMASRHTIHFVPGEVDPRTGGALSTVPDGEVASVRIGNWNSGAEAEAVTYKYTVDYTVTPVLMLKYALVLQAPYHDEDQNPRFDFQILDYYGQEISSCTSASFVGTLENLASEDWYEYSGGSTTVVWKDWTTVGINLANYDGQTLKIRLTTKDCSPGAHYAYAYFTLGCATGEIEGINSGDTPTDSFIAPDGFDYKWYKLSDPTTILSTEQIFYVESDDFTTYAVDCIFKEDESCYFTLTASAVTAYPIAKASYELVAGKCEYTAHLTNESYFYVEGYEDKNEPIESIYWIYPDGAVDTSTEIDYTMPNDGSEVSIKLVATIGDDLLTDTAIIALQAPIIIQDTLYAASEFITLSDLPYTYKGNVYDENTAVGEYITSVSLIDDEGCGYVVVYTLIVEDDETPTSVSDISTKDLAIYPNPISSGATLYISAEFTTAERDGMVIEVINSVGQCVIKEFATTDPIEINGLSQAGVYIVRITTGTGDMFLGKVVVE